MPPIEFDPAKDAINRLKHGLSLADAAAIDWRRAVLRPDDRFDYGEPRFRAYAMWNGRLHMAAITLRGDAIRVISFRPANRLEVKRHGQAASAGT